MRRACRQVQEDSQAWLSLTCRCGSLGVWKRRVGYAGPELSCRQVWDPQTSPSARFPSNHPGSQVNANPQLIAQVKSIAARCWPCIHRPLVTLLPPSPPPWVPCLM